MSTNDCLFASGGLGRRGPLPSRGVSVHLIERSFLAAGGGRERVIATGQIEAVFGDHDADSALVAAALQDPEAFEALYAQYARLIHRYCLRRLGDPELAADATAAIFARV